MGNSLVVAADNWRQTGGGFLFKRRKIQQPNVHVFHVFFMCFHVCVTAAVSRFSLAAARSSIQFGCALVFVHSFIIYFILWFGSVRLFGVQIYK
jgi:hypothetical protein